MLHNNIDLILSNFSVQSSFVYNVMNKLCPFGTLDKPEVVAV